MNFLSVSRFVLLFAVAFSLMALPSVIPRTFHLPLSSLAHATLVSDEAWVPAGPEMNVAFDYIFTTEGTELVDLQSLNPSVDFTDVPLPGSLVSSLVTNPNFAVTQLEYRGASEIEFNLANNYWGCDFNFGNSACGIQIRQGIAHLIDKVQFVNYQLGGQGAAIDNPLSAGAALPTPNSCAWDASFPELASRCMIGGTQPGSQVYTGGTAYHLGSATGGSHGLLAWQPYYGDADFCAAAQHFINAGIAMGHNSNCVLTGVRPNATTYTPNFFIRTGTINDQLTFLGTGLSEEICALFGRGFVDGCGNYLTTTYGRLLSFPGYITLPTPNKSWWMFTEGAGSFTTANPFQSLVFRMGQLTKTYCKAIGCDPFDMNLYFSFNSRFVSGSGFIDPPCQTIVPNSSANNYVYLCNSSIDAFGSAMEYSSCLVSNASNDVDSQIGQTTPTYRDCAGNPISSYTPPFAPPLSALSAGLWTEDVFGRGSYTIPVFTTAAQFAYLQHTPGNPAATWQRAINSGGSFNYFTWLNAHNSGPVQPETLRQGFSDTTTSLNPYIADTALDIAMIGRIYDSLLIANPYDQGQFLDWMTVGHSVVPNGGLSYTPPWSTQLTFRFQLWPDLTFQDLTAVTAFDVAFSYLSLLETGSILGTALAPFLGITILNPNTFDINVNSNGGAFVLASVASPPILPGKYWASATIPQWDNASRICGNSGASCFPVQYTLGPPSAQGPQPQCSYPIGQACTRNYPFPASMMIAPQALNRTYDPLASSIQIGSGPWECVSRAGVLGQGCSSTTQQNPGASGSYTLQRFGKGIAPSFPNDYFRSSGNLALWLWAGGPNLSSNWFSIAKSCFGLAPVPLGPVPSVSSCAHWQQGIGTSGATTAPGVGGCPSGPSPCGISVGTNQLSMIKLYSVPIDWLGSVTGSASTWNTTPPTGIVALDPLLYSGNAPNPLPSGYPNFAAGGVQILYPASSKGCEQPYPMGGYDC